MRPMRALTVMLLVLLAAVSPAARAGAAHIIDPWPGATLTAGIQPQEITFQSSDPFTPAEAGHARTRLVKALLFLPPGAPADHTTPAVVLLHGSVGNVAERAKYGPPLAAMGVATLLIETYASRPDLGRSFIGRALHITETMFDADAYAGLHYLASRPEIDAHHVVLAGFSYGGMATEYALYDQLARALSPDGMRFAGHVAYYAPCIARFADRSTTGAPLLMLYGGRDELIRPDRCAQVADDLRQGGSQVTIVDYPDAVHQWDGVMEKRLIGRHLAACSFRVDPAGHIRDVNTGLTMSGPIARGVILALCTGSRPWPIGRDDAVTRQSNRDFGQFLTRIFSK